MIEKLKNVGYYDGKFNDPLNLNIPQGDIFESRGLKFKVLKKHPDDVRYLPEISNIISCPDYVGNSPNHPVSLEFVKVFDKSVLVAMERDTKNNYYYISSLYSITNAKLKNRLFSGRLIKVD